MKNDNSIEGNKAIAEFCGYKYHRKVLVDNSECGGIYDEMDIWSKREILVNDFGNQVYFSDDWYKSGGYKESIYGELKYHTSWDWQIPVWSKIIKISQKYACDESNAKRHNSLMDKYENAVANNEPETGQKIILEAIQWYNQTKIKTNEQ